MSVAEGFLHHGQACVQASALGKTLEERFLNWAFLVVFQRQWFRDKRINKLYAPALLMMFASSSDSSHDITTAADNDPWCLLFYHLTQSCGEVLWESKGVDIISDILQAVPLGFHPSSFAVICVTIGDTHERLGLFSDRAFSHFRERVEGLLLQHGLQQVSVKRHHVAATGTEGKPGNDSRLPLFVEKAIEWACRRTVEASDVSAPSQKGNDAILALLPQLNKVLYTMRFYESNDDMYKGVITTPGKGEKKLVTSRLVEERCVAVSNLKKRVGNVASFTLPPLTFSGEAKQRWHVLIIQRLFEEKQEVSFENLDPGQLEPQPMGAELHIMRDGGEVLYLQSRLCDEKSFDTFYGDMLHEDGELFVQLTPLEGIAFDDIDHYLDFIVTQEHPFGMTASKEPLCKGSCSGYTFPKVVYRRPTGVVLRDTVITSPHVEIVEEPPRTSEEWEVARHTLAYLSDHIIPLSSVTAESGYTLARTVEPVLPPAHNDQCAVCGRCRDKLLRCGGCRVEMYCCKKHQMMDWKDGHKKKCGLWRKAREEYESRVLPLLQSQQSTLPETPSASAVTTLLEFITTYRFEFQMSAVPVIHIIGIDSDVDVFLSELARHLDEFCVHWKQLRFILCSDAFKDENQNSVYAIYTGGSVLRTPPTSVLGDVWHTQTGGESVAQAAMLVRLYNAKYHILVASSTDISNGGVCAPSAVVSFGSPTGIGMSYFTAAAEVLADRFIGVIPVLCTEPTLVSAHRTMDAIFARVQFSSVVREDLKKKVLARLSNYDDLIQLNLNNMGREALELHSTTEKVPNMTRKQFPLVLHPNLYLFCISKEC